MKSDVSQSGRFESSKKKVVSGLGVALCLFTLFEVNYNVLQPQSALAVFVGLGLVLCFLTFPASKRFADHPLSRCLDLFFATRSALTCL